MLADFFTKPLQGSLFRFFQDIIMAYTSITEILDDHPRIKESVENFKKYKSEIFNKVEDHITKDRVRINEYVHPSHSEKDLISSEHTNVLPEHTEVLPEHTKVLPKHTKVMQQFYAEITKTNT